MEYLDLLERAGFWRLQEQIAAVTGLAVITTDPQGRPMLRKSNLHPYCALINASYEGKIACETFRRELARAALAAGRCERRVCHAGLVNFGAPVNGQAVLIAGGVAAAPLGARRLALLAEEVRCPQEKLQELAQQVPVWDEVRLAEAGALLQTLASFTAGLLDGHRMLTHVLHLGDLVAGEHREDAIVECAVQETGRVLGVPVVLLRTYDEEKKALVARAVHGVEGGVLEAIRDLPVVGSLAGQAFTTGRPVAVPDVRTLSDRMLLPQLAPEVRSALIVPLRVGGRTLGTLAVYATTPRTWDETITGYLATIAAKVALALENARLWASLCGYYLSAVKAVAIAVEARDVYTRGHSLRVAALAKACAEILGLEAQEQEHVYLAGLLHDIGKVGVEERILLKPGPLAGKEWDEIRAHPEIGAMILTPARLPAQVIEAVRHHHEDYDGGGYPAGMAGEEIPLGARIIRVADAYDAMTSERPYRPARTVAEALRELERGAGRQFDPQVVEAFVRLPQKEEIASRDRGPLISVLAQALGYVLNRRFIISGSEWGFPRTFRQRGPS